MRIAVGSTNPVKVEAVATVVERAFPGAMVESVEVPSGVPHQPRGDAETRLGALNRARAALRALEADLGVGLEGGVAPTEAGLTSVSWCAVVDRNGRIGVASSGHWLVPPEVSGELGRGSELGEVMDRLSGLEDTKRKMGAIGIVTRGLLDRRELLAHSVLLALVPFLSPRLFGGKE